MESCAGQWAVQRGVWCGIWWALFLAHCSSSWYWRFFRVGSALVCRGSFSTLMTWCSSRIPRRSVSPSSMRRRLAWKVNVSVSTLGRPSSWSLVLVMMSSRNLSNVPVLSAVVVLAINQSSAHSACRGSTRNAVASLNNWSQAQTMSAAGVMARLGPPIAELWMKWMSTAPCLMYLFCRAVVEAVTVPLLPDIVWPGESPGPLLNIKTVVPRYEDSHVKGKTVVRPSYL